MIELTSNLLIGSTFVLILLTSKFLQKSHVPAQALIESLPWIGSNGGQLRWLKAVLRSVINSEEMVQEGYNTFSKQNSLFVLPTLSAGPVIMLPSSHLHILNRPEREIAAHETQFEIIQPGYTMAKDKDLYESTIAAGFGIVWKCLTRPKDVLQQAAIVEVELAASFRKAWGDGREWRECKVFETCAYVIARTTNRTYFGLPLSRDEELLEQSCKYAEAVFGAAAMISIFPGWLRCVMGPVLAIPAQRHLAACRRILIPYVEERLKDSQNRKGPQSDILQLLIDDAKKNRPEQLNALHITYSLLAINQSSIYSTAYGLTNCILDLFSSDKCEDFVQGLREECERVSVEFGGNLGSGKALDKLCRLDSCIRESMRVSGFNTVALMRKVSAPHGIKLEGIGTIPQGVRIGAPIQSIHFDPSFYSSPSTFDAFRFSTPTEEGIGSNGDAEIQAKQQLSTHISKEYIPWGYGKHACPGRWVAVQMMKLAMTHLLMNYDIQPLFQRPKSQAVLNVLLPPTKAIMTIRRRAM